MDKTVNSVDDLSESTEVCDRNDSCLNNVAYLIVSLEDLPRIVLSLLEAERNSVSLSVEILDVNFKSIANAYDLARVLDPLP